MKFNRIALTIALSASLFASNITQAKKIFCDLGEVLLKPSTSKALRSIGIGTCLDCMACGTKPSKKFLLEYLSSCTVAGCSAIDPETELPACYNPWFTGTISSDSFVDSLQESIENDAQLRRGQKGFLKAAVENMRPQGMRQVIEIIPEGLKFLKDCTECLDTDGQSNELYIISNWDKDSYPLIKEAQAKLFAYFKEENITISGLVGMMKPHKNIFEHVICKHNLTTMDDCIFIDDTVNNCKGARKCGFAAIEHKEWRSTRKTLRKMGVFGRKLTPEERAQMRELNSSTAMHNDDTEDQTVQENIKTDNEEQHLGQEMPEASLVTLLLALIKIILGLA